MKKEMIFTLRGTFIMLLIAALGVVVLYLSNMLPQLIDKGFARKYESIEDVKRSLDIPHIKVPSYFPEGISWPPSLIVAQTKPFWAIAMEFKSSDTGRTILSIIQTDINGRTDTFRRLTLNVLNEEAEYLIKQRRVLLKVGLCDNDLLACNKLSWHDNTAVYEITSITSPFDAIKIAEGMMH